MISKSQHEVEHIIRPFMCTDMSTGRKLELGYEMKETVNVKGAEVK